MANQLIEFVAWCMCLAFVYVVGAALIIATICVARWLLF